MFDLFEILMVLSPVAVIYLLWIYWDLKKRLGVLEAEILHKEAPKASPFSAATEVEPAPKPVAARQPSELPETPVWSRAPEQQDPPTITASRDSGSDGVGRAITWFTENWFYAVAAVSLALSGIFATQYGADLLTPAMRIAVALIFGSIMVGVGEIIRRRFGDGVESIAAYLPSVFSGAGIVTLFGAVLAARSLYELIGADIAIGGLVFVATISVALGWAYGPLLAAVGLLGATSAPFLVGGDPGNPILLQGYFGLIAVVGLFIHSVQRWRGFDALSLIVPCLAAFTALLETGGALAFMVLLFSLALIGPILGTGTITVYLPGRAPILGRFLPAQETATSARARLYLGTWIATAFLIPLAVAESESFFAPLLGAALLTILFCTASHWSWTSRPAIDMAASAAVGLLMLGGLVLPGLVVGLQGDESAWAVIGALAAAVVMSLAATLRSAEENGPMVRVWAIGAFMITTSMFVALEMTIRPGRILGVATWSGIAMSIAVVATFLAERAARLDGDDRLRASLGGLVSLTMIALSLFATMKGVALSVALGVLTFAAATLDDKFRLPPLAVFVQAGVAVLLYRSVVDPGLSMAFDANWGPFLVMYLAPIALLGGALLFYRDADRPVALATLEVGVALLLALTVTAVIMRITEQNIFTVPPESHAWMGLIASAWLLSAWVNLRNAGIFRKAESAHVNTSRRVRLPQLLRYGATLASLLIASGPLIMAMTFLNPIFWDSHSIFGVPFISSILPAYALPGAILLAAAWHLSWLHWSLRWPTAACGIGLMFGYACLSVAHAWRGPVLAGAPIGDGELWTYTALLLIIGVVLFTTSLRRQSLKIRYMANAVLVLVIGKVFVVDASGLDGLVRAGSFLILGLSLAGLAWVNRLVTRVKEN